MTVASAQTAAPLRVFIPITKVDIEKRLVYGIATAEAPDLSGEVCDYASTKPLYQKWSDDVKKGSGGKSVGNLRSMHSSVSAGKLVDVSYDDEARQIDICAKVVDDNEWRKVTEGVYTGFSQGGSYVKRWVDDTTGLTHYTADPIEISLVDVPCLPSATFSVIKAEGLVEKRAFMSVVEDPEDAAIMDAAKALAAKAGADKPWREFAEQATTDIIKAARANALAKMAEPAPVEPVRETNEIGAAMADAAARDAALAKAEAEKPAKVKKFNPVNINKWDCGCEDHNHGKQHEAVACMKKRAAEIDAAVVAKPVESEALAKLEAALGIGGEADLGKAVNIPAAHHMASDDHMAAAEMHEYLAAHPDATPEDAKAHLKAAMAHRMASKANTDAATKHETAAPDDTDASKAAAKSSDAAHGASIEAFAGKDAEKVRKDFDESKHPRDGHGKFAGGDAGDAASHSASIASHVAHTIAEGIGGIAGSTAGEKIGSLAGRAIATVVTRGNAAAGEAGAEVGSKVGATVGGIAGSVLGGHVAEYLGAKPAHDTYKARTAPEQDQADKTDALGKSADETTGDGINQALDRFATEMQTLVKAGARNSAADADRLQKCHDLLCDLGAKCEDDDQDGDEVEKLRAENEGLRKSVVDVEARFEARLATVLDKVTEMSKRAAPAKAAVRHVEKSQDNGDATIPAKATPERVSEMLKALPDRERADVLMKLALSQPVNPIQ